jgi:hypothetical protein
MEKHHPAHVGLAGSFAQKAVVPPRLGERVKSSELDLREV